MSIHYTNKVTKYQEVLTITVFVKLKVYQKDKH